MSFLVEEIHRPFGADRGERENRVAEVFESFGHRLALFVVPVPQYVVHLVSAREVAADAEADAAVLLRAEQFGDVLQSVMPAGGHNGLKNITELLGTEEYSRIRFGIGGDFPRGHQVDYVLGHWNDEERKAMPERLKYFGDAILSFAAIGPERTMNLFNKK